MLKIRLNLIYTSLIFSLKTIPGLRFPATVLQPKRAKTKNILILYCCLLVGTGRPLLCKQISLLSIIIDDKIVFASYSLKYYFYLIGLRLCGNYGDNLTNPYKITSTTNLAAIHFRSSSKNEFKGFSCKWTVETARTVPYSKEGKFNGERKIF